MAPNVRRLRRALHDSTGAKGPAFLDRGSARWQQAHVRTAHQDVVVQSGRPWTSMGSSVLIDDIGSHACTTRPHHELHSVAQSQGMTHRIERDRKSQSPQIRRGTETLAKGSRLPPMDARRTAGRDTSSVRTQVSSYLKPEEGVKICEKGEESDLLRDNMASLRASLAQMTAKCAGMEPESQDIERLSQPPQEETVAERIRRLFGGHEGVIEGVSKAGSGIACAIREVDRLWPELDAHVEESDALLSRFLRVGTAMEQAAAEHRQTLAQESKEPPKRIETFSIETQTEPEEKTRTKYWTEGFELELTALRLANAQRMAELGLQHKDQKGLLGDKLHDSIEKLRAAGDRHQADAQLYKKLSRDLSLSVKGLVSEREKMLVLIHQLSAAVAAAGGKVVSATLPDHLRHMAVQTDAVSIVDGDEEDEGGDRSAPARSGAAEWKNIFQKSQKQGGPVKMPLAVFTRIAKEVLQEMRRVVRENEAKPFPDLVFEYFMFKFGLKSVAEARLKDTILAAIEYQSQAELARIFAGLAGLLQRPYEQDAVMLLSAGYDALVSTTDGGSTQSRSWFELGPVRGSHVILSDALAVLAKLFASGDERHRLSPPVYKEAVARMLAVKVRAPADKDPIPAKVNRAAYQRYRTVMKSRESAASLMPNDKVTISVDHWLEIVLDTVFVFLAEQEETLMQIFKRFDADGDGQLTLDEFMELTTSISPTPTSDKERRRQEGEAREAYGKMMQKSKDGVITPKVFAKEWRHHFLALEKAELHALTAKKREAGEAGADLGAIDGIDVDDGHGVYNWDRVLDESADAEWDLEQFCKEHAIPADNIFSAHASDILSEIRALVDANSKATTPVSDRDLGSCVHLLKRFKEARVKAERHVTRLQRVFNVARPGREDRVRALVQQAVFKFKSPIMSRKLAEMRSRGLIKDERPPATTANVPTSNPVTLRYSDAEEMGKKSMPRLINATANVGVACALQQPSTPFLIQQRSKAAFLSPADLDF